MTAVTEINRQLVLYQEDLVAVLQRHIAAQSSPRSKSDDNHSSNAAGGRTAAAASEHPFDDPSSLLVGLLVRVAVPKKLVDRLVIQRVPQLLGLRAAAVRDDEVAQNAVATAKKEYLSHVEGGRTLALVGVVAAALLHVSQKAAGADINTPAASPPSLILLVRFGEVDDTFQLRHISPLAEPPSDDELEVWRRSTAAAATSTSAAAFVTTEMGVALQRRRRYIQGLWDASLLSDGSKGGTATAPGTFARRSGNDRRDDDDCDEMDSAENRGAATVPLSRARETAAQHAYEGQLNDVATLLSRQREATAQMKQELARKNDEVYQLALAMREQQSTHASEIQKLEQQMSMLAGAHEKQRKEQQEREAKLRPLIETVKPLHQLFKLVKEKLGMPQGTLETVERALREATVVPRPRAE